MVSVVRRRRDFQCNRWMGEVLFSRSDAIPGSLLSQRTGSDYLNQILGTDLLYCVFNGAVVIGKEVSFQAHRLESQFLLNLYSVEDCSSSNANSTLNFCFDSNGQILSTTSNGECRVSQGAIWEKSPFFSSRDNGDEEREQRTAEECFQTPSVPP
ncbi:hypothetical protein TNIN_176591 [Trichonephila inaurata madagascariensis]|uniref:Uncharacterized protein n=1 Tax=Trichonephila inaurata madagascariensis TaxID=2747483 RepID=A0A8X6XLK9_9ARAC|nr:hypothetical protein TNIN_176591 [Trichonephila inaurata madagascariensis]